jgi:AGZA family xanthine/uracil permease-like MFS transporter
MAVTVLVGVFKIGLSFCGNAVRSIVPRAALLGSIGGAGIALIGVLPLLKIFADPLPGLLALSLLLVTLVGRMRLPGRVPGALASALVGIAAYYVLRMAHLGSPLLAASSSNLAALHLSLPWPSLAFLGGLTKAWGYLPIALPFALSTVVGGIDNTESAAVAGDEYDTRAILLTEGCCTLAAGLCDPHRAVYWDRWNCRSFAVLCGLGPGVGDRSDAGVYRAGSDCAGVSGESAKACLGGGNFAAAVVCLCDFA